MPDKVIVNKCLTFMLNISHPTMLIACKMFIVLVNVRKRIKVLKSVNTSDAYSVNGHGNVTAGRKNSNTKGDRRKVIE